MAKPKGSALAKAIPINLDQNLLERIETIAKETGEPKSTIMRMALRVGLRALTEEGPVEDESIGVLAESLGIQRKTSPKKTQRKKADP